MILNFIYEFDELEEALENITDKSVITYQYLSWLGLSHQEILMAQTDDYNPRMRVIHTGERVVYVKDDKIALTLANAAECGESMIVPDADAVKQAAEESGVSPVYVYKMGYFREKFDLKRRNQPEDLMSFKKMIRYINENENELAKEFSEYEKNHR